MGGQPAYPGRGRRPGIRHRLGHPGQHPQRWPAPTGATGQPAGRRMGRDRSRRAHQPPRHPRHHLARRPPTAALGPQYRRPTRGHPRPLVPRRGRHHNMGSARRNRRTFRRRLRGVRAAARRAGPADRRGRSQAAEPAAQGAGLVAPRRTGADLQAQVPDRGRQPTDRRRAATAQHRGAGQAGGRSARKGRRRPARRVGLVPAFWGPPGVARHRMADRPG